MPLNLLDRIGEINPQLFRELKGPLKVRNVAIAVAISLLGQLLLLLFGWQDYPGIQQIFSFISVIVMFALLVMGTYMLISDLAREEHRGTLNFIRLSPQSARSILGGKMLGVPMLLYLAAVLTIPLHLWSGLSAQIPLVEIISFWAVMIASCAFFYSGALLFGLVSSGLSGFQAWLGSGAVLLFLCIASNKWIERNPGDWLKLFCPFFGNFEEWQWFGLPLGASDVSVIILALLNYSLWTYWIWQALNRRFHNLNATILSKRQSYLLSACFAVVSLGFAVQSPKRGYSSNFFDNFISLLSLNLLLLVGLIAVLSPHRQDCTDWARYRRKKASALIKDLIWGEKSPAVVAIAINLSITSVPMAVWILFWPVAPKGDRTMEALLGLVLILSLILIYATLTQLMLLMKTNKRAIWAAGTVVAANVLPPSILMLLSLYPDSAGKWVGLWLFTTAPWDALKYVSAMLVIQALLVQWSILGLLNWQLTRQLRRIGESESKALFAGHP